MYSGGYGSASYGSHLASYGSAGYAGSSSMTYAGPVSGYNGGVSFYGMSSYGSMGYTQADQPHFSIAHEFLAPNRPLTPIISTLGDIKEIIEQAYTTITGEDFPFDAIRIVISDEEDFRGIYEAMGGIYQPGIMGFSFNQYGKGVSEVYVKQDHMDRLLLTLGHEIGHVLSPTLPHPQDEEAKAHAFSLAWMETIRDNDIGGLEPNIAINPAQNGLHDVAYHFVLHLLHTGASSLDIFKTLSQGLTSMLAEAQ